MCVFSIWKGQVRQRGSFSIFEDYSCFSSFLKIDNTVGMGKIIQYSRCNSDYIVNACLLPFTHTSWRFFFFLVSL